MNKFLKIFLIIIVNLLFFVAAFLILDYTAFKMQKMNNYDLNKKRNFDFQTYITHVPLRDPIGTQYNKKPIIVSGCSYAYGAGVEENETLAANLSRLLKSPVYNIGTSGTSIQHAILTVENHYIDNIIKDANYFIYIFIGDHFMRVIGDEPFDAYTPRPVFVPRNGKLHLKYYIFPLWDESSLVYYLKMSFYRKMIIKHNKSFEKYLFDLVKMHFMLLNEDIKAINPNIKLVVLLYKDDYTYVPLLESPRWSEYKDLGIEVVDISQYLPEIFDDTHNKIEDSRCFTNEDYCVHFDGHPNARAWTKVADLLVNKLQIIKE